MVERALVGDRRAADEQRSEHDVAVANDPADVARRPPDVALLQAEHPLRHRVHVHLITAVGVHRELRLRGRPARREDVRGLVGLELDVRVVLARAGREEVLPGHLVLHVLGRRGPAEDDHPLDCGCVRDGLRDDAEKRHVLALAVRHVRREESAGPGESDPLAKRARAESREDDQDDRADADRAEHQDDRFSRRRHVDGDAIALRDTHRTKGSPDALGLTVKLGVGQRAPLSTLVLRDEGGALAAPGGYVMVDAVVGEVRHSARVPAKGGPLPVQDALPLLEPRHLLARGPRSPRVIGRFASPCEDLRPRVLIAPPAPAACTGGGGCLVSLRLRSSGTNSTTAGICTG